MKVDQDLVKKSNDYEIPEFNLIIAMIDQALSDSKSKKYLNKTLSKDGIKVKCEGLNPIREQGMDWIMNDNSSLKKYVNLLPRINSNNLINGLRKKVMSIIEKDKENEKI